MDKFNKATAKAIFILWVVAAGLAVVGGISLAKAKAVDQQQTIQAL